MYSENIGLMVDLKSRVKGELKAALGIIKNN